MIRISFLLFSTSVFAQTVLVPPVTPPAPTDVKTVLGWILTIALTALTAAVAWGALKLTQFLNDKSKQSLVWNLTNTIWVKAQAAGSAELTKNKELLEKILADGKVTPEEFALLKNATIASLKLVAAAELELLGPVLKILGDGPVTTFLEGLASKVVHNLLGSKDLTQIAAPPVPPSIAPATTTVP